jgi:hypothetical protein
MLESKSFQLGGKDGKVVILEAGQYLFQVILLDFIHEHKSAHWRGPFDYNEFIRMVLDLLGLVELELSSRLALFEDERGFGSGILVIKILIVLARKMFEAAFNTPSEFEERASTL